MSTLLVSYDLHKPEKDYRNLLDELKRYELWWHCLESFWLLVTAETSIELRDKLKAHIDNDDELLVIDVTGDAVAGVGFDQTCRDWLRDNL